MVSTAGVLVAGKLNERSGDAYLRVQDGIAATVDNGHQFLPSTGSVKEFTLGLPRGYQGHFTAAVVDRGSNPSFGGTNLTVHVGEAAPAGYAYPAALAVPTDPQPPTALANAAMVDDDLHSLAAWTVGGYSLNGMTGYFCAPGARTASGKAVDPIPLVTEGGVSFRRFEEQDFRRDPVAIPGGTTGWCMGALVRSIGGATGLWMLRERMNRYSGMDMADLWGTSQGGGWPPEMDSDETFSGTDNPGLQNMTWHLPGDGRTTGGTAYQVPEGVWIDRLVQRSAAASEPGGFAMYRQWVRLAGDTGPWRLVYEMPDFLEGNAMTTVMNNEGWHGGEPALGATPFDPVAAKAYFDIGRVRYWPAG